VWREHRTAGFVAAVLVGAAVLAAAAPAEAAHHLVRIRQVFPGTTAQPKAEFVVLQLTASGENQFTFGGGSSVRLYGSNGAETNSQAFTSSASNGSNQATVLVATPTAATTFGVTPDLQFAADTDSLSNSGGAACFTSVPFGGLDCAGWGSLTFASPPSPIGTPEATTPADNMLERSIGAGCPSLFELSDDTNDSAADFAPVAISPGSFVPRNNAAPITETPCAGPPGNPTSPINPAGNVRKRKCKKRKRVAAPTGPAYSAKKKKCKKKKRR
jgi:hypothetical protein